jgi:hypothetical protein
MIPKVPEQVLAQLHERMKTCYQFENMDMLQHGVSVAEAYKQLVKALKNNDQVSLEQWIG